MSLRTRRGLVILASMLFVATACTAAPASPSASQGGTTSASPSEAASGASESPGESASESPSGGDSEIDLFGTDYPDRRTDGTAGGTVIIADWQEATLFQPYYQGQVTEADVSAATFSGLVTSTDDFKYAPDLAADIPTLDNGGVKVPGDDGDAMTVTWTLRDGLKWSDGEALDCDDVAYTWEWNMDPDNTGLYGGTVGWEDISGIDCPSPTEVVVHFSNVYEGYIGLISYVLPEHYVSTFPIADQVTGAGFTAEEMADVPTNGPMKFESVTPGSELRMVRNENWQNPATGEPAYLDGITFKWYADAAAMIAGYGSNEYDLAKDLNEADLPSVETYGDQVHQLTSLTYEFLRPNWNAEECSPRIADRGEGCPAADPAIREAIRWAIDKNEINDRLLAGAAEVAETNTSPNAWFYAEPAEVAEFDPEQAKQVLEDAGWTDEDGDGVREKDGLQANIELCTTTRQVRQDTLALVSSWLKDVGIASTVNAVSADDIFATFNESTDDTPCVLQRHMFDVAEHAFSVPLDPNSNYTVYHSTQSSPEEGQNNASVNEPEIDAALDTVKSTVDFSEILTAMSDFQRIYVEKTVEIPLYFRKEVYLVNPKIQNFTGNPTSTGPLWNVGDWYVQE
jgi:peptide/nickel transport system substrate-binding protein